MDEKFSASRKLWFYFKISSYYMMLFLSTILSLPIAIFRAFDVRNPNMGAFILTNMSKLFLLKYEIRGLQHLTKDESAVIVCNHQSSLDVIGMMQLWPKMPKCAGVFKKSLLYAGPFGIFCWLSGCPFVNQTNAQQCYNALDGVMNYLTELKIKLWFFPEGTRNESGKFLPFKKGAFYMAIKSQRPIVPITFSSYESFYNSRTFKFDNGGKIIISVLPPIPTEGLTTECMKSVMDLVTKQMEESFENTSYEIAKKKN